MSKRTACESCGKHAAGLLCTVNGSAFLVCGRCAFAAARSGRPYTIVDATPDAVRAAAADGRLAALVAS